MAHQATHRDRHDVTGRQPYPVLPQPIPVGSQDMELAIDSVRQIRDYLAGIPTVERIVFQGVAAFPMKFGVTTKKPFFVALSGRPYPDSNSPTVEVLGLTFTWAGTSTGATVSVESIDGVAAGDQVTLLGIVVGEAV